MFERFSAKSIKVIMLAQEEARQTKHNYVGSEHILLGLIGEGTGAAALVLRNVGLTLKDARSEVEKITGPGNDVVHVEIPFTPSAKKLLELSFSQAIGFDEGVITTEHLLMALIAGNDGVGLRVLENLKIDVNSFRSQVSYLRREQAEPFQKPFLRAIKDRLFGKHPQPEILSPKAVAVMDLAQEGAKTAGYRYVGSDQLLLAILTHGANRAAQIMNQCGVTLDAVRSQSEKIIGTGPGVQGLEMRNTPRTDRIIAQAHSENHDLNVSETDVDQLLLSLLKNHVGAGMDILRELGADYNQLRAKLS